MKSLLSQLRIFTLSGIALLFGAGCLEWDRQVTTYRYDRKSDTLLIFQDYRGIYGADHAEKLLSSEIDQLESVLKGGRTFFFSNWILEINLQKLPDMIADLQEEALRSVSEQELNFKGLELIRLLRKNCAIENGDFYLDGEGRISGVQTVKFTQVSKLLPQIETVIHAAYKNEAAERLEDVDAQTHLNTVSAPDWKFVQFKGNQLIVRLPMTKEDFEKDFRGEPNREQMENFEAAGMKFDHLDGVMTFSVGKPKDKFTRVEVDTFEKKFRDNFRAHLPKETEVKQKYNADAAARRFVLGK